MSSNPREWQAGIALTDQHGNVWRLLAPAWSNYVWVLPIDGQADDAPVTLDLRGPRDLRPASDLACWHCEGKGCHLGSAPDRGNPTCDTCGGSGRTQATHCPHGQRAGDCAECIRLGMSTSPA